MKKLTLTPLCLAIGMAFAVPASILVAMPAMVELIFIFTLAGSDWSTTPFIVMLTSAPPTAVLVSMVIV